MAVDEVAMHRKRLLLLNILTCFIVVGQCATHSTLKMSQSSLQTLERKKYSLYKKIKDHGGSLPPQAIISSHTVYSQVECSMRCLQKSACVGFNYIQKSNQYAINCQLSNKTQKRENPKDGEWTFYQDLETLTTKLSRKSEDISTDNILIPDNITNCKELYETMPWLPNGYYRSKNLKAYCDLSNNGWTLIARFSNGDPKHWMKNATFWYDKVTPYGNVSNPSANTDMISTAFWEVESNEFKITRNDDSNHTALLQTTSSCLQGGTFRSKITSYGNFRNGAVWASNQCRGSCQVSYGGQYKITLGFNQHSCSSTIQSSNYIGFWCDWGGDVNDGKGAVMMIGGGGKSCSYADHGIGVTDENHAKFGSSYGHAFGSHAYFSEIYTPSAYSLNLWVR